MYVAICKSQNWSIVLVKFGRRLKVDSIDCRLSDLIEVKEAKDWFHNRLVKKKVLYGFKAAVDRKPFSTTRFDNNRHIIR